MLKKEIKKQIIEMINTLQEGVRYAQTAKIFIAKKIFLDSIAALELIKATSQKNLSPKQFSEYEKVFNELLALFQKSKIIESNQVYDLLQNLVEMFKWEKEICKEVLFLPYKASMWDSLESIWKAAEADDKCECYVMPIPYCDRKPDGQVFEWHYEGNQFPGNVPITSFGQYDIAKRRPDIIYIHNPYDGYNRVTSVHPDYYSNQLKKYTGMLVYVPYFVTIGESGLEHFCQMPGVINADRVIVQSEKAKEIYTKYISREKILALGSPKFEKVFGLQQHSPSMPEEWEQISHGRKLIFYNTHLSPLMIDNGSVCRKLRYVFSCFEDRDDVCLLWRPHPLSQATMQAMNPKPMEDYMELIEEYKQKKFGIYDDSPDVHRAIAVSDAYYGDRSSLVSMYGITGKPIMLQDVNIIKDTAFKLVFNDAVIDGNIMWFSAWFCNGFFKMDLTTKEIFYIGNFPGHSTNDSCSYRNVVKFKEKIYFIPFNTNTIIEFNVGNSTFKAYVLPIKEALDIPLFQSAFLEGDWIWLMPMAYHSILRFNVISGETEIFDGWYEELRPHVLDPGGVLFRHSIRRENYIWFPFFQGNIIMRFSLIDKKVKIYKVAKECFSYRSIAFDGENFWLTPKEQNILIRWNKQSNETKKYEIFLSQSKQDNFCFVNCIYLEGFIWIFLCDGRDIIKFDIVNENFSVYDSYPEDFICVEKTSELKLNYLDVKANNELIDVFPQRGNMMLRINGRDNKTSGLELLVSQEILNRIISETNILQERKHHISLSCYLNFIVNFEDKRINERKVFFNNLLSIREESCGKKINDIILNELK